MLRFAFLTLAATMLWSADPPMAEISNGILKAKLYLPDATNGYYRGTRFDWSGQIASLTDGKHEYYGKWFEKYDPNLHDAIMGPVEEFTTNGSALGYDEAKPGGTFVRIGVGVLKRPDDKPYQRFRTYEIVSNGKWTVDAKKDHVRFVHELPSTNGYAWRYTKVVRLVKGKPQMVIEHQLENRGEKPIESVQYNHNFFVIDGQPTGPDSYVEFPFALDAKDPMRGDAARFEGGRIVYTRELQPKESASGNFKGTDKASDYDIRVGNKKTGASVRIVGDKPIDSIVYWSIRSTFCPEPYIKLSADPGKKTSWTYTYTYGEKSK